MHQNGHIRYVIVIFVAGTFWPKIEKMAILSVMMAIFGHFLRFLPDYHLVICFSDQQDFGAFYSDISIS